MLQRFYEERGLSESTKHHYNASVKAYLAVTGAESLDTLLEEADNEELQRLPWKQRKIRQHLIDFRNWLYQNKREGTVITYMSDIKGIYRHFEIEIHKLPPYNSKQIQKIYVKKYEDIPTRQELIDAYYEANSEAQDVLLFASSSGMSKVDLLNLTVSDFLEACNEFCLLTNQAFPHKATLLETLIALKEMDNIIPCFKGERQKTNSRFVTFASPEFTEHKLQHLIGRDAAIKKAYNDANDDDGKLNLPDKLYGDDKLFNISNSHLSLVFRKINDKLDLGRVGSARKFRCHQLRAYQATTLLNIDSDFKFSESEIDTLQGRVKDKTHRAYLVESTSKLFKKYSDNVDALMLFKRINVISEEEVENIRKENNFYKKEIVKNENKLEEQQKRIQEIISNQRELEALLGL